MSELPPPPDEHRPAPEVADGATQPAIEAPPSVIPAVDLVGTVALVLAIAAAGLFPGAGTDYLLLAVSAVLFLGGCVAFTAGFVRAVGRSRYEDIHLAGLFYLTGTVAPAVRTRLWRLWIAQIVVACVGLAVTDPPFGTMAPVWGIGLMALYGGRYGRFRSRPTTRRGAG